MAIKLAVRGVGFLNLTIYQIIPYPLSPPALENYRFKIYNLPLWKDIF